MSWKEEIKHFYEMHGMKVVFPAMQVLDFIRLAQIFLLFIF